VRVILPAGATPGEWEKLWYDPFSAIYSWLFNASAKRPGEPAAFGLRLLVLLSRPRLLAVRWLQPSAPG
jgi:hypothetical protein